MPTIHQKGTAHHSEWSGHQDRGHPLDGEFTKGVANGVVSLGLLPAMRKALLRRMDFLLNGGEGDGEDCIGGGFFRGSADGRQGDQAYVHSLQQ